jgi:hypothetical protein
LKDCRKIPKLTADSRKLRKSQEKQGEFNMKLLKSLERIKKKLENESDSRKTESRKTPERKRRSRSVRKHHRHSSKHSSKEAHHVQAHIIPRNNRRSGVDELKGEMNNIKPPTFDGEHMKEEDVETWFLGMRKYFQLQNYSSHAEGRIVMYQLKGKASMWWERIQEVFREEILD